MALRYAEYVKKEGFAEYMGAVTMDRDRNLTFIGLNRPRLEGDVDLSRAGE